MIERTEVNADDRRGWNGCMSEGCAPTHWNETRDRKKENVGRRGRTEQKYF